MMAPVKIKFVVSFSSQDPRHKVDNVLKGDGLSKWLCSPENRTGNLEAVFQLERAYKITNLDIGTFLTFTVHVSVGCSSWPSTQPYIELLSGTIFSSVTECRFGKNKTCIRMFKYGDFSEAARDKEWDRLKVVLTQPFRKEVQFGLSLLRIATSDDTPATVTSPLGKARSSLPPKSDQASSPATSVGKKPSYGPSWKSAAEIKNLFFKNQPNKNTHKEQLVEHLSKIGASTENGNAESASMSRNLKLVVAAAGQTPLYKNSPPPVKPRAEIRKRKPTFEEEAKTFLKELDLENIDMDTTTFADLRHKLEKKKCRKLTKEERLVFKSITSQFLDDFLSRKNKKEKPEVSQKKRQLSDSSIEGPEAKRLQPSEKVPSSNLNSQNGKIPQMPPKATSNLNKIVSNVTRPEEPRKSVLVDLTKKPLAQPKTNFSPTNLKSTSRVTVAEQGNDYKELPPLAQRLAAAGYRTPTRKTDQSKPSSSPQNTPMQDAWIERQGRSPGGVTKYSSARGGQPTASTPQADTNNVWLSAGQPSPLQTPTHVSSGGGTSKRGRKSRGGGQSRASPASGGSTSKTAKVPCPVCKKMFAARQIEMHASLCGIEISSDDDSDDDVQYAGSTSASPANTQSVKCPICSDDYPASCITRHVDICMAVSSRS